MVGDMSCGWKLYLPAGQSASYTAVLRLLSLTAVLELSYDAPILPGDKNKQKP
jgi:hypothetical protein